MRRRQKVMVWLGGIQVAWSLIIRCLDWIGRYDLAKDLAHRWAMPAILTFLLSVPGQLLVFAAGAVLIFTGLRLRPRPNDPSRARVLRRAPASWPLQWDDTASPESTHAAVPDLIETLANVMLTELRVADGEPVYLKAFDGRGSQLEIDEAISRLRERTFIEVLGGYPDPVILYLTAKGRRHVVQMASSTRN